MDLATLKDLLILENKLEKQIFSIKSELKEEIHKVENKILWWIVSGIGLTIVTQIVLAFLGSNGLN